MLTRIETSHVPGEEKKTSKRHHFWCEWYHHYIYIWYIARILYTYMYIYPLLPSVYTSLYCLRNLLFLKITHLLLCLVFCGLMISSVRPPHPHRDIPAIPTRTKLQHQHEERNQNATAANATRSCHNEAKGGQHHLQRKEKRIQIVNRWIPQEVRIKG